MDILLKAIAGVLIALVLCQILNKNDKNIATLLVIMVCCMVVGAAYKYIEHLLAFFEQLEALGNLNADLLKIMLKAAGIGLLAELTILICADAGNGAMGKSVQILSSVVILWMCIPVFTELIALIEDVMGAV